MGVLYDENKDEKKDSDDGVDENPQPIYHKWKNFMSFKPDIPETPVYKLKPINLKHYNKQSEVKQNNIFDNKEALYLAVRLKALNDGFQFLADKLAQERYELKCYHLNECAWKLRDRLWDNTDMVSYLKWKIPRRFTTLYYTLPPKNTLLGMKAIKNDYDTNVMYDIAKVYGKLQIFISHSPIDLSTVLIPNDGSLEESFVAKYIFPNASLAEMMSHVTTDFTIESEDHKKEQTQNDYTFDQLVEWAEQEHFEDEETKEVQRRMGNQRNRKLTVLMAPQEAHDEEACLEEQILSLMHRFVDRYTNPRPEINKLNLLPDHPLIEYGCYALGCMTGADMKKATYLKMVRDELLRSMEEKRQLIKNYKEM
ncbi:hypothetical protein Tco_0079968 [Tanacetum coccineum]